MRSCSMQYTVVQVLREHETNIWLIGACSIYEDGRELQRMFCESSAARIVVVEAAKPVAGAKERERTADRKGGKGGCASTNPRKCT